MDLSYNQISKINFSNNHTVYRLPLGAETHYVHFLKRRYLYISGNPFYDNCKVGNVVEFRDQTFYALIYFITGYLPKSHTLNTVEYIPLKNITCLFEHLDNAKCPEECSCLYRFSDYSLIVNCGQSNLTLIPKSVPDIEFTTYTELNLPGNNITTIKSPLGSGYQKVIKYILSDNAINDIDLTAFSPRLEVCLICSFVNVTLYENYFTLLDFKLCNAIHMLPCNIVYWQNVQPNTTSLLLDLNRPSGLCSHLSNIMSQVLTSTVVAIFCGAVYSLRLLSHLLIIKKSKSDTRFHRTVSPVVVNDSVAWSQYYHVII